MGSMSSKPLTDALDDIARNVKPNAYHETISENNSLATTSLNSGCHLDDPRSPSSDITRTPIRVGQKLKVLKEKADEVFTLFDPRSPGVPRTPIYAQRDEVEVRAPMLDTTPIFALPSDASTPLRSSSTSDENESLNRSLEQSLSDPNLSMDAYDEKLLIRSSASPIAQNRTVTKLRRSMKRAKNLVRQKTGDDTGASTKSPRGGLKAIDVNSPRAFVLKKASMRIDGDLKRRHTVSSSPYQIQTQDKENLPYS